MNSECCYASLFFLIMTLNYFLYYHQIKLFMKTLPSFSKDKKKNELKNRKPPSYLVETFFITSILFFFKFYSLNAFAALTFVTILIPFMIYHILNMFGAILSFVTSLHIETDEEFQILSPLQIENLVLVIQHLLIYLSLYTLSGELDDLVDLKKAKINMFE